jgi:conjugative transfer signal peptidase TraF
VGDRHSRFPFAAGALVLVVATVLVSAAVFRLTYNSSASLPLGVYQIRIAATATPRAGDIVGLCLDGAVADLALRRGYVHPEGLEPWIYGSRCPGGIAPIGKPVAAVAGDTVLIDSTGVRINGRLLRYSRTRTRDRAGRRVPHSAWGRLVLRPGEVWVQSEYTDASFDSRVFGPVPRGAILDRRVPVLTLGTN